MLFLTGASLFKLQNKEKAADLNWQLNVTIKLVFVLIEGSEIILLSCAVLGYR